MSEPIPNEMTGGEALARTLKALGAGPMFGMGGFQLLPFYDAMRRLGLAHILINDERCGIFAADAYAKLTGRVGLCDGTLGPGATNLLTGLAESANAATPLVAVIGDTHRGHSWKHMTQETHQVEALKPVAKDLLRVEATSRIPELVQRAFAIATSGRPGPVVLDVPEDVCHDTHGFAAEDFEVDPRTARAPAVRCRPDPAELEAAAALLRDAGKPLILAGGGVHISDAAAALQAFARELGVPVAHTMTGKGALACLSPLSAGLFGRYDRIANELIGEADALFVVGCKLGEIATKRYALPGQGKRIVHLDISPEEFGRTVRPEVLLWSDVRAGLAELHELLKPDAGAQRERRAAWSDAVKAKMDAWREATRARYESDEVPVNMARLIGELNKAMPDDGLLVADGGFAAHWSALLYETRRAGRHFVPDRGFASIGYGLPGAIGCQLAAPQATVAALTGDGGFNMMLGELETARRLSLGVTIVVVNNAASGYVKALQHLMYGEGAYQSSDLAELNYADVATAMGCHGIRVERPGEIAGALAAAFAERGRPSVLDVVVTRDPSKMLPGVDSRAVKVAKGDRVA